MIEHIRKEKEITVLKERIVGASLDIDDLNTIAEVFAKISTSHAIGLGVSNKHADRIYRIYCEITDILAKEKQESEGAEGYY